jgi:hypothetical protein
MKNELLAPNGKPSNLTPEQYKLVRTTAFKKWFGDWENDPDNASKVIDENGEPLIVYHGTNLEFTEFKNEQKLSWFTPNLKEAKWYASKRIKRNNGRIISCFLNLKKPLNLYESGYDNALDNINVSILEKISNFKFPSEKTGDVNYMMPMWVLLENEVFIDELKNKNFDGLIVLEDKIKHFAILKPNQIKLSDGTNSTFDSANDDIRFEQGGETKSITPEYLRMFLGKQY